MTPRRWQEDRAFVAWLEAMEYAGHLSNGLKIYLWEAWTASRAPLIEAGEHLAEQIGLDQDYQDEWAKIEASRAVFGMED